MPHVYAKKGKSAQFELVQNFLNKNNTFAVVGVSSNPEKYGYKVYFDLLNAGFKVYPIHPENGEINGRKRYSNLQDLPQKPDVVSIVVPPAVSLKIVKQCQKLGIDKVWLQPGSESNEVLDFCRRANIKALSNMCIMVKRQEL